MPIKKSYTYKHTEPLLYTSDKLPNSFNCYLGIDQSLTCTSLAFLSGQQLLVEQIRPSISGVPRLSQIYEKFGEYLDEIPVAGAAIEGYSMGSIGRTFNLGELGGVLRMALYQRNRRTIQVPPTTLKKFFTGKGNAQKFEIIGKLEEYGLVVKDDNDADAIALALACHHYFETPLHFLENYQTPLQAKSELIIGEHPNPVNVNEYAKQMGDLTIGQFEKKKRGGNPKPLIRNNIKC